MQRYKICVCKGKSCAARFSKDVKEEFEKLVRQKGCQHEMVIADGGCYGRCQQGPNVLVMGPIPDDEWKTYQEGNPLPGEKVVPTQMYIGVLPPDARELFEQHCVEEKICQRLAEQTMPVSNSCGESNR